MIYLDNAATTLQKPISVSKAVANAIRHEASVGRGGHLPAMKAAQTVYACRVAAASFFDCEPEQVVFTMNATHALNIAIKTLVYPHDEVVISGFEHNAVLRPLDKMQAKIKIAGRKVFDPEDTLSDFEKMISKDTKAVICTHVSNVFGYILPIEKIAELCRKKNVPLIVDASQSAGVLPISMKKLNAAFVAMPGHKSLYGPQGTGMLLCGMLPETIIEGGSGSLSALRQMPDFLPDRAEAGTHNVCGIAGLLEGIRFLQNHGARRILEHEILLRKALCEKMKKLGVTVFEGQAQTGVCSAVFEGMDCEEAAAYLAKKKIAVRAGLHCAPLAHESAGTIESGTVRFSFSAFNSLSQIERLAIAVKKM